MKYMLMMHTPGNGPLQIASWPADDIKAHIAFMMNFGRKLAAAGELVGAEGLSGPEQARRVRAGASGEAITDGVFPETRSSWPVTGSLTWTRPSAPTLSPPKPQRHPVRAERR